VRSIRVLQKITGDPYYEPTIVVHDTLVHALMDSNLSCFIMKTF